MATTPIEFTAPSGLTLTADLVDLSDDSLSVTGGSCTEQTNADGQYRFDHTGTETGVHKVVIKSGGTVIGGQFVNVLADDTTVYRANDSYEVALSVRAIRTEIDNNSTQFSAIKGMAAYPGGFVYIHDSAGSAGTTVGTNGTISNPSNTVANAVAIANSRGIKRLKLLNSIWGPLGGDVAFESVNIADYIVDLNGTSITLANNVDTSRATFLNGVIDKKGAETYISLGGAYGTSCRLTDIVLLSDVQITHSLTASSIPLMERVKFAGSVTFLGNSFAMDAFVNCGNYYYDYTLAGLDNPTVFDTNGKKVLLRLPGWYGDAKITNMTNASSIFKFYGYGALTIDATCTGGTVYYTSHISITDNSGGAVTLVPVSSAATEESIADAVLDEALSGHETNGTLGKTVSDILVDTGTDGVVVAAASKTGYALSAPGVDAILDEAITEPSGMFAWGSATLRNIIGVLGALLRNKVTSDSNSVDVRNDDDDATLWSYATSDDDTTFTSGEGT